MLGMSVYGDLGKKAALHEQQVLRQPWRTPGGSATASCSKSATQGQIPE
jgi:hypothetical protein